MNSLLKGFIKEAFDLVAVGKDIAGKQWASLFGALVQSGEDVPAIVSSWADLKPELEALLANPAADSDLLSYVLGLVSGDSAKAQAVISASANLVLNVAINGDALLKAFQLQAAVAPAAEAAPVAAAPAAEPAPAAPAASEPPAAS
jgi:hypothetical protein